MFAKWPLCLQKNAHCWQWWQMFANCLQVGSKNCRVFAVAFVGLDYCVRAV